MFILNLGSVSSNLEFSAPATKRKCYAKDFTKADMSDPNLAETYYDISASQIDEMRKKIKRLNERLNYQEKIKQRKKLAIQVSLYV
jgi:TolA-binding protein